MDRPVPPLGLVAIALAELGMLLFIHRSIKRARQRPDRVAAATPGVPRQRMRLPGRLFDRTGQSLVEAAIITPLLLVLTFAIIDFGMIFFVNLALENGVSQAVRYAVTGQSIAGLSRRDSITRVMRESTPTLTLEDDDFAFSHLEDGDWVPGLGESGDVEKLTVTYTHEVMVLRPLFSNGRIEMRVESSMKNEDRFE